MKNTSLKELLKVFVFKKISPDNFRMLKDMTAHTGNEDLDNEIKTIWDETTEFVPMEKNIKESVLNDIHRQIDLPRRKISLSWLKIAGIIIFPLICIYSSYLYFSQDTIPEPDKFIVMVDRGQKTQVILPDETEVWLNSGSRLIYFSDFTNNRKVALEGEAFFEVKKEEENRFTVETDHVDIIVHGTSFNISAYKEDTTVNVSLLSGKIALHDHNDQSLLTEMLPNQFLSVYKNTMQWQVFDRDVYIESLWIQQKLKFENASVKDVFRKLERWYGMNIDVENANPDIHYGFTLKSESLREMLDEINKITPITYKIEGEEVYITYK